MGRTLTGQTAFERLKTQARRMADQSHCGMCVVTVRGIASVKSEKEAREKHRAHPDFVKIVATVRPTGDEAA
jgi:hypothetical protein